MNPCAVPTAQKEAEKVALYLHKTALVLFTIPSKPVLYTLLLMAIKDVARSSLLPTHIKLQCDSAMLLLSSCVPVIT